MATQSFDALLASGLLREVEEIVVDAYATAHPDTTRPEAYRWLRYEDPDPVARLLDGVKKLRRTGATFEAGAVDKACAKAANMGYLNL